MTTSEKHAQVDAILGRVCARMKVDPVKLDADGRTALQGTLDGRSATITVSLHEEDDVLMLLGPVGRVPFGEAGQQILLALLGLNVAVDQTAGTAFAWDPHSGTVLLTHALVGPAITHEVFSAAFFRVFGAIIAWQDRLEKIRAVTPVVLPIAK